MCWGRPLGTWGVSAVVSTRGHKGSRCLSGTCLREASGTQLPFHLQAVQGTAEPAALTAGGSGGRESPRIYRASWRAAAEPKDPHSGGRSVAALFCSWKLCSLSPSTFAPALLTLFCGSFVWGVGSREHQGPWPSKAPLSLCRDLQGLLSGCDQEQV